MKLSVTRADPQDQAGVLNNAFWGVPVNPITTYKQSFYAKADAEALGPVTIRLLTDADDTVLASATVSGLTSQWKQYQFSLKAVAIRESSTNHLVLTIGHPGVVAELGFTVSTPRTTNAPTAIASTSWKSCPRCIPHSSVFPAATTSRESTSLIVSAGKDHWPARRSAYACKPLALDGMGLLEFLEWCEDLNMQPVLAVYAGYSLAREHINPGPDLEPYVQHALDEIEVATAALGCRSREARKGARRPLPTAASNAALASLY